MAHARATIVDRRLDLRVADARSLPLPDRHFDAVASGLMLNFVPDPACAVVECVLVAAPTAVVAAHVWEYAGVAR